PAAHSAAGAIHGRQRSLCRAKRARLLPLATQVWKTLSVILIDDCKITSGRFLRGHNSLLPFVAYLMGNPTPGPGEKRRMVTGIYITLITGIFSSAEARMGSFARNHCKGATTQLRSVADRALVT